MEVVRSDITPVITFSASVVDPYDYQITAPIAGVVTYSGSTAKVTAGATSVTVSVPSFATASQETATNGLQVALGQPLFQATAGSLVMSAPLKPVDELRFLSDPVSAKAEIDGAAGPFDCPLLDPRPSVSSSATSVGCSIPVGVRALTGLSGLIAVRFPTAKEAVAVPVGAVSGSLDSGEVLVKRGGQFVVREVKLGVSDGNLIQVTSGLAVGDVVQIPGPSLSAGQ